MVINKSVIPAISVIIPVLNAEGYITTLLEALNTQSYKPDEIIVIDSSSDDQTVELAREGGARIIVIQRKEFNHGLTRNLGVDNAKGEFFVFMTQDALPANNFMLENLIEPIVSQIAQAAYARQIPRSESGTLEQFWRKYNYSSQSMLRNQELKSDFIFSNVCSAYEKKAFTACGGFARLDICEDKSLAHKLIAAGYTLAYQSDAQVIHSHDHALSQRVKRYFLIGRFNQCHPFPEYGRSIEKKGLTAFLELLRFLADQGAYRQMPVAVFDVVIRFGAYVAGRIYSLITRC